MPIAITVLYPNVSDATFNLEYYLSSHMPMVQKEFGAHGMKGWRVQKYVGRSPYSMQATLEFENQEQFKNALQHAAGPVLGDVPNFSNKSPVLMVGEVVGEHKG
ncbi:hypothetical protein K490DRAFT_30888 [Saccharata proteae CBS 121410]|uniref:EthD domain-containing protein n=1 Tax=Saccharata proteae CBS 121410 TaxID=1314787 RepID=A0A9P4HZ08_9PEZI|nr:hypothetical protein K490DRAFT_30888 [Saccharata proteae CBS 121410]